LTAGREIHVGKGDEARFDAQNSVPPRRIEGALLQNAQELALGASRKGLRLRRGQLCRCRQVRSGQLALDRAGEGTALVTEEFRFRRDLAEGWRNRSQKRCVATGTEFVHKAREVVFARAAFAVIQ